MKKIMILFAALVLGALSASAQINAKDTVYLDKSFEDAGAPPSESTGFHLAPRFFKAGDLPPAQPIALSMAKKEAVEMARAKPTPLRRDCLNIIYTVAPIYSQGSISGALKGTITIKWDHKRRVWALSYLKYQLINIDQNAYIFQPESD